jgi:PAS domain S-box-containing protein
MKILYVADTSSNAEQTRHDLSANAPQIEVDLAASQAQAKVLLAKETYDLVLIDLNLTQEEGLKLITSIQNSPAPVAVVCLASPGGEQTALQAINLGASDIRLKTDGYLTLLPAAIENAVSRSQLVVENNRYRSLLDEIPVGIFRMTVEGSLLEANPAMLEILHLDNLDSSAPTNLFARFVDSDLPKQIRSHLQQQGTLYNVITRLRQKDDTVTWIDLDIRPVHHRQGELLHLEGTVKDITERARAESSRQSLEYEHYLEQAILLQLAQSLLSTNDVQTVMDLAVQESAQGLSVPYTALALLDEPGQAFSIRAEHGYPAPIGNGLDGNPLDSQTEISYVIANNTPAIIHHPDADLPYQRSPHVEKFGIQSSLVVPMSVSGQQIGAMIAETPIQRTWKDSEIRLFTLLASATEQSLQRARFFQQMQQSQERLRYLSQQLVEVQEKERYDLARELHDQVGQTLSALKLHIQLTKNAPHASPIVEELQQCLQMVEGAIHQVRDLARNLRPSVLDDFGLEPALRWHLDNQAQLAGFTWELNCQIPEDRLPGEIETVCYRVAQVAITNVVNHARASHVTLQVWLEENVLKMDICDNGIGFDVPKAIHQASLGKTLGLLSMTERTELLGGKIDIESKPGKGTCVHMQLPLTLGNPIERR